MKIRFPRFLKGKQQSPEQYQSRSRLYYSFFFILGFLLLAVFLIHIAFSLTLIDDATLGIVLAFAILLLGVASFLYFICYLFAKLSRIAQDIEQNDEFNE